MSTLIDRIIILRDEVLQTADQGDLNPVGEEFWQAVIRALGMTADTLSGLDLGLREATARRLAWGDTEAAISSDAQRVLGRVRTAAERALRSPHDHMLVLEAVSQVGTTVERVLALHAVNRNSRDRAARIREEMAQRQLREACDKADKAIERLRNELHATMVE